MPRNPFNYKSDADCNGYIYALMWLGSRVLLLGSGTALLWMGILYTTTMFSIGELLMGLAIVAPCLGSAWMLNNLVRRQKDFDLERSMIKIKKGFAGFSILVFFVSTVLGIYLYLSNPTPGHWRDLLLMSISPLPWLITGVGILTGRASTS
jgi:hypothetical protein